MAPVRGSVAPRRLELELCLPSGVELNPLIRRSRPDDVVASLFQPLVVMCFDPHRGAARDAETPAIE
jgi:hypothetical protein